MVQGYYTLEEASRILGLEAEELSQMAQKRQVRAFADRGTWRFRTQDIEELARRRGIASNPDLQLGEAPKPKPHDSPARKPGKPAEDPGVFSFPLGADSDQVEIGQEVVVDTPSSKRTGGKSSGRLGAKTPPPKPGSDSDVRLVAEGSDINFKLASDSDVKVPKTPAPGPKSGKKPAAPGAPDSSVRLIPVDSEHDSDVKIVPDSSEHEAIRLGAQQKPGTDSDIRIEPMGVPESAVRSGPRSGEDSVLTEEIDLDAELRKAEQEARAKKPKDRSKDKPKSKGKSTPSPITSPFELSDSDLEAPKPGDSSRRRKAATESSSDFDLATQSPTDSSSDFELSLKDDSASPIELAGSSSPTSSDDEVDLGATSAGAAPGHDSGINLQVPADSGISLEQGGSGDEIEFELSLDTPGSTPKPAPRGAEIDSDSEFELTLDDSGGLAPLEDESSASGEEKDIFETDFEVPALEDDSGSQVAALDSSDTDLESSDFDLALGEEDIAGEEDSGSQVVVLEDEEDVDEGAATIARPSRSRAGAVDDETADSDELLGDDLGVAEDEAPVPSRRAVAAPAAPVYWGPVPAIGMFVCTLVMFLVGAMGLELLHGMWGYRQGSRVTGTLVRPISEMFVSDLPKD